MANNSEHLEHQIESAINDFRDDLYSSIAQAVEAYNVKARTLQKRVKEQDSLHTRSATNRTLNSVQEAILFEYIARLNVIDMSSKSRMLTIFANRILQLIELRTSRRVEFQ